MDLIITSDRLKQSSCNFEVLNESIVIGKNLIWYHAPVICTFKIDISKKKRAKVFHSSYLYEKADWVSFKKDIDLDLVNSTNESQNTNVTTKLIFDAIAFSAAKNIPKSKENKKRFINYTEEIRDALNSRNYWKREFVKNRDEKSANKYKLYEEKSNNLIGEFKLTQWKNFLERQGPNPLSSVPFWRRINRLRSNKRRMGIAELVIDGKRVTDPVQKANAFAENLAEKFSMEENNNFNKELRKNVDDLIASNQFRANNNQRVKEFSYDELTGAIKSMNNKTSLDGLGISNKMLKNMGPFAKEVILKLFNTCLTMGEVPNLWKHSIITMILKTGQENSSLNSYRPISTTPCLARLFERLVLHRLSIFLKVNNIIIANQSGFRRNRQTKDNLLYLIQNAQEAFNCEEKAFTIFFDVAAAFDKVWHNGLLYKLFELKVPLYLILIIKSFLEGRTFTVKIDGKESGTFIILCGVPQGGVLSPTLFSIYINNIPLANGDNEITLLFADDLVYQLRSKFKKNGKVNKEAS